jgi:hypothetical protein
LALDFRRGSFSFAAVRKKFMPAAPVNVVPIAVLCLIGWRVYGRCRRSVGRQPLNPKRMILRIVIYALLTLILAVVSLVLVPRLTVFAGLLGGLAPGAALGLYGLHLTRFETTAEGRFYTPNPYMGVGVSMLLVARLAYRILVLSGTAAQPGTRPQVMQSPLTFFLFGLLAGYYMAYFNGVLAHSREKLPPADVASF